MGLKIQTYNSLQDMTAKLEKAATNSMIRFIGPDGLIVRFASEIYEGVKFGEYWDNENKTWKPEDDEVSPPADSNISRRWLLPALEIEDSGEGNRIIAVKLPKTIVDQLLGYAERFGTIMDRDYILEKSGQGKERTTYRAMADSRMKRSLAKHDVPDRDALVNLLVASYGGSEEEAEEAEVAEPKAKATAKAGKSSGGKAKAAAKPKAAAKAKPKAKAKAEPEKRGKFLVEDLFPEGEARADYSLAELRVMTSSELDQLCEMWAEILELDLPDFEEFDDEDEMVKAMHKFIRDAQKQADEEEEEDEELDDEDIEDDEDEDDSDDDEEEEEDEEDEDDDAADLDDDVTDALDEIEDAAEDYDDVSACLKDMTHVEVRRYVKRLGVTPKSSAAPSMIRAITAFYNENRG